MRKYKVSYKEFIERTELLSQIGNKYTYHRSGDSIMLFTNGICLYTSVLETERKRNSSSPDDRQLPPNELYFIVKVKKHIEKNGLCKRIKPNYKDRWRIKFFDYNKGIEAGERFTKGVYSVDITKAYWRSAYLEGWIDAKLYEEGLDIDKRVRLASLGSFAKEVDVYEFDGREERLKQTIKPKYPHVFFNQANTVYGLMRECVGGLLPEEFLFYWTDGMYVVGKDSAEQCARVLERHDYGCKITKLIGVERTESAFITNEVGDERGTRKQKQYKISIK